MNKKVIAENAVVALLSVATLLLALLLASRAEALPMEEAHGTCYGYALVTFEAAGARDRGVTHAEALEVVKDDAPIYTEIVNFVFDNPQATQSQLAQEVYNVCMTQLVTEE